MANGERLYKKYVIFKADGSPVDPNADYFVLRLDTDEAARAAARTYASEIESQLPALAAELMEKIDDYEFGEKYLASQEDDRP